MIRPHETTTHVAEGSTVAPLIVARRLYQFYYACGHVHPWMKAEGSTVAHL